MKKLFSLLVVAGALTFVACGPSAEEKAAAEKAKQDSIAAVEQAKADSIALIEKATADSIAAVEKAKADSLALALEAEKNKPAKSNKPKVEPKKDDATKVKAGQGRG